MPTDRTGVTAQPSTEYCVYSTPVYIVLLYIQFSCIHMRTEYTPVYTVTCNSVLLYIQEYCITCYSVYRSTKLHVTVYTGVLNQILPEYLILHSEILHYMIPFTHVYCVTSYIYIYVYHYMLQQVQRVLCYLLLHSQYRYLFSQRLLCSYYWHNWYCVFIHNYCVFGFYFTN